MNPSYQPQYAAGAPPAVYAEPVYTQDVHAHPSQGFPSSVVQNEGGAREFLEAQGWPKPMQDGFLKNLSKIAIRVFICDDSGSLGTEDGKSLVSYQGKTSSIKCTRWKELTTALKFHLELAKCGIIPTEFRF